MTELEAHDQEESLSFECELDEPPAKVWRALTEPELLAQWLLPNDFAPELGRSFTFEAEHPIECEVLAIERERSLRLRWRERQLDSVVTFTLTPAVGGGTRLRLDHAGVERLRTAVPALACASDAAQLAALFALQELLTRAPRRRIGFALDGEPEHVAPEFAPLDPAAMPAEPIDVERTLGFDRPRFRCAA